MRNTLRAAVTIAGALMSRTAVAQSAQAAGKVCSTQATAITIFVRDPSERPVSHATVTLRRTSDNKAFADGQEMRAGSGEYLLFDGPSSLFAAAGTKVSVHAAKDGLKGSATIVVAVTRAGCGIEKLSGPSAITLR